MRCTHVDPETGEQCAVYGTVGEDGRCGAHSTDLAAVTARTDAMTKARRAFRTPLAPKTLGDALDWLGWLAVEVSEKRMDAKTAAAATSAVRTWILGQGYSAKVEELKRRLAALEGQLRREREKHYGR